MSAVWIWFPGDFELYHGMLQNFQREERSYGWPAYWKMDDWRKNMRFFRKYTLASPAEFVVHGRGVGHVKVDERKYAFETPISLGAGEHLIEVFIGNMTGLPCIYVEECGEGSRAARKDALADGHSDDGKPDGMAGDVIGSDSTWMADDFAESLPVGTSSIYTRAEQDPNVLCYEEEVVQPAEVRYADGGTLVDFGRMLNGHPVVSFGSAGQRRDFNCESQRDDGCSEQGGYTIAYGESDAEALDVENCYYKEEHARVGHKLRRRAFRYIYLPGIRPDEVTVSAVHTKIPMHVRASFHSSDEIMNRIWAVASETFQLCSGMFFIDGIKRDRWIWSGDAYQSGFVNRYLYFDREIGKRTSRALRGNTPVRQHINTIVDYSMLWLISVENEYMMDGDLSYVREMYPKMEAMMELLLSQTDEHGFIYGRDRDWIYIDWADIDKEGCTCAEQILLWKCLRVMAYFARVLEEEDGALNVHSAAEEDRILPAEGSNTLAQISEKTDDEQNSSSRSAWYEQKADHLRHKINLFFWGCWQGAFIDSFASGKRHITRHANIFAILFDFADETQKTYIMRNVLENRDVPAITTPYFKFFELDAFAKMGRLDLVWKQIHDYWGGMLEKGAVTFWELYDPSETGAAQYAMYGDPYGKSLCHAWGASPIYLLGRYFLGVRPTSPGYRTFEVNPRLEFWDELDCRVPAGEKTVHITYHDGKLNVECEPA